MSLSPDLSKRLAALADLPSPPKVAMRLIELARDSDVTVEAIAAVIELDPALSAKLLRVANSAHYARHKPCDTVRRALIALGLKATLSTALSFSMVNALRRKCTGGLNYTRFWQRSLLAAIAARELGRLVGYRELEGLFLGALLQDIGMLAIDALEPQVYSSFSGDSRCHQQIEQHEIARLGHSHGEVGAWLLEQWQMPEQLPLAVAFSHRADAIERRHPWGDFVRCIGLSGIYADIWLSGESADLFAGLVAASEATLGLEPAEAGTALGRVRECAPEAASLFDLALLDQLQMQQVLNSARELILVKNSEALDEAVKLRTALASYQARAAVKS